VARVPWALSIFVLVMFPTVVTLGFWQWHRADEKAVLEEAYFDQLGSQVHEPGENVESFSRLVLKGEYGSHQYLVDNQVLQGQVGYWVMQLFIARDGRRYIVNRGWIAASAARSQLPDVETPTGVVEIVVLVWPQMGLPPILSSDDWPEGEKIRVQRRDLDQMAKRSGALPQEMRLEAGSPGVFRAAPSDLEFGRERHIGYAVQWFGLGVVLIVGWIVVYRRGIDRVKRDG
jgi:surfeit locus 1 family protein